MPNSEEDKRFTLAEWRRTLKGVLNWSDRRFDDWAARQAHVLESVYLTHDDPAWHCAFEIVPERLRDSLGGEAVEIRIRIEEVLRPARHDPDPDWAAIRSGIESILREYGSGLLVDDGQGE
jgi:hypothetical protein